MGLSLHLFRGATRTCNRGDSFHGSREWSLERTFGSDHPGVRLLCPSAYRLGAGGWKQKKLNSLVRMGIGFFLRVEEVSLEAFSFVLRL